MMKTISVLGSTGSIGTQALEIIKERGFRACALAAASNIDLLEKQAREYKPKIVCIFNKSKYPKLKENLSGTGIRVTAGEEGLCEAAAFPEADIVLNSVVGIAGLEPVLEAINAGKDIALANKESLAAGGELVMKAAANKGVNIYPVDSEHSAIFQCLQGNKKKSVRRIILTASGGPFYGKTAKELQNVTAKDALKHPNWDMGAKITIDSATMMNKGLEFIEAIWLFSLKPEQIEVVIHRQSIVHSAVEFVDGATIAQLGVPSMKLPIQYAFTYPERLKCVENVSLTRIGNLTFDKPDREVFVCLGAAEKAIKRGGLYPAFVNCVNEYAVNLFLQDKLKFLQIGELVLGASEHNSPEINDMKITTGNIKKIDAMAKLFASGFFNTPL
ncbi:MAG: 1-deoxy-D-xylulose-5-phosphate reductoisomerase [Oscillospiraceae bacterium]|nr:1-deoxy-D-xylulose-5-phosphate reductoisomerase [Oscillospiraceae bacterium]